MCCKSLSLDICCWCLIEFSIGIALGFTLPRVPAFAFSSSSPLVNATGSWAQTVPTEFSRYPANFSFPAYVALQVDTTSNYIPITLSNLRADVYDLQTNMQVATGDAGREIYQPKKFTNILLPLNFTYIAINDTDQTCKLQRCFSGRPGFETLIGVNWYNACKNIATYVNGTRPRKWVNLSVEYH